MTDQPVPTVEINRVEFIPGAGWWDSEDGDVWERVGDGSTTTESWDGEWDAEDYGTPVMWAAARIRDLSCDHNLEPSSYPLPDAVHERTWLGASYENPYHCERRETSAYVNGVTEVERAEVFRLAMLGGAEWIAELAKVRNGVRS
jgi:hypothetical protein